MNRRLVECVFARRHHRAESTTKNGRTSAECVSAVFTAIRDHRINVVVCRVRVSPRRAKPNKFEGKSLSLPLLLVDARYRNGSLVCAMREHKIGLMLE